MKNSRTNQTEAPLMEREQQPVDPLSMERNSIVVEDWFRQIEWSGKLAAVLLFNLLTSNSERHRDIGRHILRDLNENIEETEGLTSQEDMFVREILFSIVERKARKIA